VGLELERTYDSAGPNAIRESMMRVDEYMGGDAGDFLGVFGHCKGIICDIRQKRQPPMYKDKEHQKKNKESIGTADCYTIGEASETQFD